MRYKNTYQMHQSYFPNMRLPMCLYGNLINNLIAKHFTMKICNILYQITFYHRNLSELSGIQIY
jgi:hypothetical protein